MKLYDKFWQLLLPVACFVYVTLWCVLHLEEGKIFILLYICKMLTDADQY